jgi:hypothetical protein
MAVTGFYITHTGFVIEMTFDEGHLEFNERTRTSTSARLGQGWTRITNLEGFAIDLPPTMSLKARRALSATLKHIDAVYTWGTAYVVQSGDDFGREMTRSEIMHVVSKLPRDHAALSHDEQDMGHNDAGCTAPWLSGRP